MSATESTTTPGVTTATTTGTQTLTSSPTTPGQTITFTATTVSSFEGIESTPYTSPVTATTATIPPATVSLFQITIH